MEAITVQGPTKAMKRGALLQCYSLALRVGCEIGEQCVSISARVAVFHVRRRRP